MSLIATLFTKSCAVGAPVAGGVWANAAEANSPHPAARINVFLMMDTPWT